jgi:hypothetical protein
MMTYTFKRGKIQVDIKAANLPLAVSNYRKQANIAGDTETIAFQGEQNGKKTWFVTGLGHHTDPAQNMVFVTRPVA